MAHIRKYFSTKMYVDFTAVNCLMPVFDQNDVILEDGSKYLLKCLILVKTASDRKIQQIMMCTRNALCKHGIEIPKHTTWAFLVNNKRGYAQLKAKQKEWGEQWDRIMSGETVIKDMPLETYTKDAATTVCSVIGFKRRSVRTKERPPDICLNLDEVNIVNDPVNAVTRVVAKEPWNVKHDDVKLVNDPVNAVTRVVRREQHSPKYVHQPWDMNGSDMCETKSNVSNISEKKRHLASLITNGTRY